MVITETITRTATSETVVRTVGGKVGRCIIFPAKRKLTLTIRTTQAIRRAAVKVM